MIPADEPITISQPHSLELNAERLLLSQGADPDIVKARRPKVYQLAQQAVETGLTLIEPHVWKKMLRVERFRHERFDLEGGFTLQGRLPAEVLAGSERVFIAMGTLGLRLEEAIHAEMAQDAAWGYMQDAFGSAAADHLAEQLMAEARWQAEKAGENVSTPLMPGHANWRVDEGQPQLFSILQPDSSILRLTESSLMYPRKSFSLVLGLGHMQPGGSLCESCDLNATCPMRKNR
jgi:hypothetical protein